jgi:putative ABC transport system permease protein
MLWSSEPARGLPLSPTAPPDYREWRRQNHVFEDMGAFIYGDLNLTAAGQEPVRVRAARITPSLFPLLGVRPAVGRDFRPEEEQYGSHRMAILSASFWERRFGRRSDVLGLGVNLGGELYTVVGVMPDGMPFFENAFPTDLWVPLAFAPGDVMDTRSNHFLLVAARLRRGVALEQAQSEITAIAARLEQEHKENVGLGARVVPLREQIVGNFREALLVLLGAVGFVLLLACVNVANLLLARAVAREREFALRAAMGAGRRRLVRQFLVESLLVALLGGAAGLLIAAWGMDLLVSLIPRTLPRFNPIRLDRNVFAFALAASVATAVVFGLVPALHASRCDISEALKEGTRAASEGRRSRRLRNILVVAETALAVVLMVGAGLMLRSFTRLRQVDPGISPRGVLTMQLPLSETTYPPPDDSNPFPQRALAFYEQLLERVEVLPGVEAAGVTTMLPLGFGGGWGKFITVLGHPAPTSLDQVPNVSFQLVSPHYFRAIGARAASGRFFTELDNRRTPPVAIINQALARRFFPGEEPVGKSIRMLPPDNLLPPRPPGIPPVPARTIIGVLQDIKNTGMNAPAQPEVYVPYTQCETEGWLSAMRLAIRTASSPTTLASAVRAEVRRLDPTQPVSQVATMEELVGRSLSQSRFALLLLGLFAGLAVVLSAAGIYGVVSHSVAERTQEIGIRLALGARPADVLRLVARQETALAGAGAVVGLAASLALSRWLRTMLYGVTPTDPASYAGAFLLLTAVTLAGVWLPARRASAVDPVSALRCQ